MLRPDTLAHPHTSQQPTKSSEKATQQTRTIGTKLTTELTEEHRAIAYRFEQLRANVREIENNTSSRKTLYGQLAESLNYHFRREEELMFPKLDLSLGSAVSSRLRKEHAEILNITASLSVSDPEGRDSFGQLERLFRVHISTEENVLFWYLDLLDLQQAR